MSYDFIIGAGHTPQGTEGEGAGGNDNELSESNCTREIAQAVVSGLIANGKTAKYVVFNQGNSYNLEDCHYRINKANNDNCGMYIEIHLNASGHQGGTGTEVLYPSSASSIRNIAGNISAQISNDLGLENRGIKERNNLYIFNHASVPVILIECLFVDNEKDINVYNANTIANSIVTVLTGQGINISEIDNNGTLEKKWTKGWNQDQIGWFYVLDPDNKTYLSSSDGWQYIDDYWYIFDDRGYARQNEWFKDSDGKWYYLDKHCQCTLSKWLLRSRSNEWYYLNESGRMLSNEWLKYMDKDYYLKNDGTLAMNETLTIDNKEYSFDENGLLINKTK
jgi:N-acetylmuramoyl-L-alanine amidase